jgi:hypothetical protein
MYSLTVSHDYYMDKLYVLYSLNFIFLCVICMHLYQFKNMFFSNTTKSTRSKNVPLLQCAFLEASNAVPVANFILSFNY